MAWKTSPSRARASRGAFRFRARPSIRSTSGSMRSATTSAPTASPSRGTSAAGRAADGPLEEAACERAAAYQRAMDGYRLEEGAAQCVELAARANRYIQETAPWELAKAGKDAELDRVLAALARTVARLALLTRPFIPATARAIWALFPEAPALDTVLLEDVPGLDVRGQRIAKPPILFPKPKAPAA